MLNELIGEELVTCKVCGAFNTKLAKHCVKCGHDLNQEVKIEVKEKKKNNLVKIAIIFLLIISAVLAILFFYLQMK